MRFSLFVLFLCVCFISCSTPPKKVSDSRQNDYALHDTQGGFHRLSTYNNKKGIVLFVQGNGCPIVRNVISDYNTIVKDYAPEDFTFFMINSNPQDSKKAIQKEATEYGFTVPVLHDDSQLIANQLNINVTAEVFILHPTSREILYRGPINDRMDLGTQINTPSNTYLRDALDAILENKPIDKQIAVAQGCKVLILAHQKTQDTLTYTKDIAPILMNNCVKCHRPEGIGPWNMDGYQTIQGWSPMIKQVLLSRRMPPWKADPTIKEYNYSLEMNAEDTRKLAQWIDEGMRYGNGKDILKNIPPIQEDWVSGIPDEIITLKEEKIPATGTVKYRYQNFEITPKDDVWLSGIEIQPGNDKVVHHTVISDVSTKHLTSPIVDRKLVFFTDNFIAIAGSWNQGLSFPQNTGIYIAKDAKLKIQIHYNTTGKPETDVTKIGFYYHDKDSVPNKRLYALAPNNKKFIIQPYQSNQKVITEDVIKKDITIYYVTPHMHYRGKSIKFIAIHPDGTENVLVSVPDFDFNWQQMYQLKTPVKVPKGATLRVEGIFDNSFQNPFNPDPSKKVTYGKQSYDEMLIGFFNYTIDD